MCIGGLSGNSVIDRNPRSRIRQHTQGTRSGDQFCIYIQDFYVLPTLIGQVRELQSAQHGHAIPKLNGMTK